MTTTALQATATQNGPSGAAVSLVVAFALCMYFLPSIIAIKRRVHIAYVIVINLLFGWTFIGWISAFISACAQKIYIDPIQIQVINVPAVNAYPQLASPAGWYPDPGSGGTRFWDGARWTEHVNI